MGQDDTQRPLTGRELWAKVGSKIQVVGKKNSPARMTTFLDNLMRFPYVNRAAAMAGISYSGLKYWLARSEKGQVGDGFDLTYGEETKRFHEHYADVRESAIQEVEDAYIDRAMSGYYEILNDKGRVIYQVDQDLVNLGFTGPDAYLKDEDGRPIPERIHMQDPEVMLAVLKTWGRDRYGNHDKLDVTMRGGVMVIGLRAKTSADLETTERQMLAEPTDVEFREVEDD